MSGEGFVLDAWLRWVIFVILPAAILLRLLTIAPTRALGTGKAIYRFQHPMMQLDEWHEEELLRGSGHPLYRGR